MLDAHANASNKALAALPSPAAKGHVVGVDAACKSPCQILVAALKSARTLPLTSTAATAATSTPITTTPTATSAAAAISRHLGKARVDLLLGLLEHIDKVASLLLVCGHGLAFHRVGSMQGVTHYQW